MLSMRNTTILILSILFSSIVFAQQSETRPLQFFDELKAFGKVEVELKKGEKESINIEANGVRLSDVITEQKGNTLKVRLKTDAVIDDVLFEKHKGRVKLVLTYTVLREIVVSAGAKVNSIYVLEGDKVRLNVNSGAQMEVSVNTSALDLNVSEGGLLRLHGQTGYQEAMVNTGGIYEGFDLKCNDAYVKLNMGGLAEIYADVKLDAACHLGGVIRYKGNPQGLTTSNTLGGRITEVK